MAENKKCCCGGKMKENTENEKKPVSADYARGTVGEGEWLIPARFAAAAVRLDKFFSERVVYSYLHRVPRGQVNSQIKKQKRHGAVDTDSCRFCIVRSSCDTTW